MDSISGNPPGPGDGLHKAAGKVKEAAQKIVSPLQLVGEKASRGLTPGALAPAAAEVVDPSQGAAAAAAATADSSSSGRVHGGPAQIVKEVVAEVAHEVAEAVGRPLAAVGAKAQYVGVKAAEGLGDAAVFAADAVVGPTVEDADLYLHESPAVATAPGSSRSERAAEKARKKEERQEMQEDYKEAQRKLRQEHDIHKGELSLDRLEANYRPGAGGTASGPDAERVDAELMVVVTSISGPEGNQASGPGALSPMLTAGTETERGGSCGCGPNCSCSPCRCGKAETLSSSSPEAEEGRGATCSCGANCSCKPCRCPKTQSGVPLATNTDDDQLQDVEAAEVPLLGGPPVARGSSGKQGVGADRGMLRDVQAAEVPTFGGPPVRRSRL